MEKVFCHETELLDLLYFLQILYKSEQARLKSASNFGKNPSEIGVQVKVGLHPIKTFFKNFTKLVVFW